MQRRFIAADKLISGLSTKKTRWEPCDSGNVGELLSHCEESRFLGCGAV
jgi:hypothetical protein